MDTDNKKQVLSLGGRIVSVFLLTIIILIVVIYGILSHNFQSLMTDYTVKLVQSMVDQGVEMVECELDAGRKNIWTLAKAFKPPDQNSTVLELPEQLSTEDFIRLVYVSQEQSLSTDGLNRNIRNREDIQKPLRGCVGLWAIFQ